MTFYLLISLFFVEAVPSCTPTSGIDCNQYGCIRIEGSKCENGSITTETRIERFDDKAKALDALANAAGKSPRLLKVQCIGWGHAPENGKCTVTELKPKAPKVCEAEEVPL